MKTYQRGLLALLLGLSGLASLQAQVAGSPAGPARTPAPVPYAEEEFPDWLRDLDRAKTLAIGAFPFTYLLAGLVYDLNYYASSGFNASFTPWPAGTGTASFTGETLNQKNSTLVWSAIGLSLTLALSDYIIGQLTRPPVIPGRDLSLSQAPQPSPASEPNPEPEAPGEAPEPPASLDDGDA